MAATKTDALPTTLKSITATKIEELRKQRTAYENHKARTLSSAKSERGLDQVNALLEGAAKLEGLKWHDSDDSSDTEHEGVATSHGRRLRNQRRFVQQARVDPSFSKELPGHIAEEIQRDLDLQSISHEHAQFFSDLVTEWLDKPDGVENAPLSDDASNTTESTFQDIGRKEMHEQRAEWESIVFNTPDSIPQATINHYLTGLFDNEVTASSALEVMRKSMKQFSTVLEETTLFDAQTLKTTIKGLLKTDLLSDEKQAILKTFIQNKQVLGEVRDVLNMRYASLSTWAWTTSNTGGVTMEMRKQLNGKYRVFMDEDCLDAIIVHAIGLKWAVQLKAVFTTFFNSYAWDRGNTQTPKRDRERRQYFLGDEQSTQSTSVQESRRTMYAQEFFMTQLPVDEEEGARGYNDDDTDSDDLGNQTRKGPLEIKHLLLHLLMTESLIATKLHGEFTVVRSDFKWFGPSLSHNAIFATLRFFGVSESWIRFFTNFLRTPLSFTMDGPQAEARVRSRGVPMSHVLSDTFGETLMFVMDYAVNQATKGAFLYRLHDDFWIWGQEKTCLTAWQAMCSFAKTFGMAFNEEKTGTVRFREEQKTAVQRPTSKPTETQAGNESDDTSDSDSETYEVAPSTSAAQSHSRTPSMATSLPIGDVRWGFLQLSATHRAFVIDQSMVDSHIKELRLQLSHCNSIFSYTQAYNAYFARFFSNNFGKPSFSFGKTHIDQMISTFARIQHELFPDSSITDHLRAIISDRFNKNIGAALPDGFFFWPTVLGGLELQNPFIRLLGIRANLRRTPQRMLEKALDKDVEEYHIAKIRFETESHRRVDHHKLSKKFIEEIEREFEDKNGKIEFMSLEEYTQVPRAEQQ